MQSSGDIGEIVARILSKIFKNRPNCGYAIFTFLIIVVLSAMIFGAKNSEDLVLPILLLAFVLIVVLGRAFRTIWKHRTKEYQVTDHGVSAQEEPNGQEIMMPDLEGKMNLTPQMEQQVAQNPSTKKGYIRQVFIICVIFFALGYLVAYLFDPSIFAKVLTQIIPNWTISQAITDLNSIRIPLVQLLFGLPCAFIAFIPILIVLYIIIIQFIKPNLKITRITHAVLSFISGIVLFGPLQIFLLFAGNI